jgi:hypothetical protein
MMLRVEIQVREHLDVNWMEWLGGFTIIHTGQNETILTGLVPDQAALYGVISRLRDLGLQLISVSSEEIKEDSHEYNQ